MGIYNLPQNRLTGRRLKVPPHQLDQIIQGWLDRLIELLGVTPDGLIPRPKTEILLEEAPATLRSGC